MQASAQFALFDTAIGRCGIAWRDDHVRAVSFPANDARTIASLRRSCSDAIEGQPPAAIAAAIARIEALLAGHDVNLDDIALDLPDATAFERRVYDETIKIRRGTTRTYGEIAAAVGEPQAARAVGRALGRNPVPLIVPCHRVMAAGGKSGGFSGAGGISTKLRLLRIEGALAEDQPSLLDGLGIAS